MSPRAAWRLETLGFTRVYDYVAGRADWFAAGLPRGGRLAQVPRVGDVVRRDDVTCRLTDRVGEVRDQIRAAGKETCLVATDGGVLLGRVPRSVFDSDTDALIEAVMESGPTTIRPDRTVESMVDLLRARNMDSIVVTTSDGRLVGTLHREDAEPRGGEADEASCICDD